MSSDKPDQPPLPLANPPSDIPGNAGKPPRPIKDKFAGRPLPSNERPLPEDVEGWFSKAFSLWMDPLFYLGWMRPIQFSDLWHVPPEIQSAAIASELQVCWLRQLSPPEPAQSGKDIGLEGHSQSQSLSQLPSNTSLPLIDEPGKAKDQEPSHEAPPGPSAPSAPPAPPGHLLRAALWSFLFRPMLPLGALKFFGDLCSTLSPLFMRLLLGTVGGYQASSSFQTSTLLILEGVAYSVGLFALQFMSVVLLNNFTLRTTKLARIARSSLSALIYRKVLKLSTLARREFTGGKAISMTASDCTRIESFIGYVHYVWATPLQIVIICVFLVLSLGPAALAGVGVLAIMIPVQTILRRRLGFLRRAAAPIADERVKFIQEILNSIRTVKFFAWEHLIVGKIRLIRNREIALIWKRGVIQSFSSALVSGIPVLAATLSISIYAALTPLTAASASVVFASLSWFASLRFPLLLLPTLQTVYSDFDVGVTRIQELFLATETDESILESASTDSKAAFEISNGSFCWEIPEPRAAPEKPKKGFFGRTQAQAAASLANRPALQQALDVSFKLEDINIKIKPGTLVAIVGGIGAGKSSLISAIVGEMKQTSGQMGWHGTLGYCPQQPWIQNATLEDNITFGKPYDEAKFARTIDSCCLQHDIGILPDGVHTQIGERGINLSGGQKQRVSIARCLYYDSDIVLLDDPLSAVDAHVGKDIFEKCILGELKDKTRILVTHQLHVLPQVDHVVVMAHGRIIEQGTYPELLQLDGELSRIMKIYGTGSETHASSDASNAATPAGPGRRKGKAKDSTSPAADTTPALKRRGRDLFREEDRPTGGVDKKIWLAYTKVAGGKSIFVVLLALMILAQTARVGTDYWLVPWSTNRFPSLGLAGYIGIYWLLGFLQTFFVFLICLYFSYKGISVSRTIHLLAFDRILHAPSSFFDTTPVGRIINRFSSDQDAIDNSIIQSLRMSFTMGSNAVGMFITIVMAAPWFLAALGPLMVVYYYIQNVYRRTSRELKRLDSLARSPIYAYLGESAQGTTTIRAFGRQSEFVNHYDALIDKNNSPGFLTLSAQRWLGIRLDMIGAFLVFFAAILGLACLGFMPVVLYGLALSYALQVTSALNQCVRQFSDTEISMNAVERVYHYAYETPVEEPAGTATQMPPESWPSEGKIDITNLKLRYQPHLPLVLNGVSLSIHGREKIGIVGRTGSGKSSLINSLFRITPCEEGSRILIDGVDIHTIPLSSLRSGVTIIPQDPVLFSGTIRSNLDPFDQYEDHELWDVLEKCHLKDKITRIQQELEDTSAKDQGRAAQQPALFGLEIYVQERGENWSVGQRQLMCLARAMLRKPRILVMDEATANVDYETDQIIQSCLRTEFANSTLITIAHRLNTVIDYDRVVVMKDGLLVEVGSPAELLDSENKHFTLFKDMVKETGASHSEFLAKRARPTEN
ncbi:P-loop containing nucleoside triphosphate hydrolase protein [Polychytrium aggregatum]|uniref:P-loop containing nucleoside triphosphate hydrolase protein n=1 Tax=Polychytrium aggregatum TaxID=110093 RepID=UPI0022FF3482|nr:P-loop containing nucleoside triphosphate hydrolase protein [Polychytrium aggregatum]KAI9205946.1 P-loop containing nucleoside triphosphate hydrolase protein [Polychytrium aggregatum]